MYRHTITFTTKARPNPGDLPHLIALLKNKSNNLKYEIKTEEVV